jgi:hypothetical protein
LHAFCLLNLYSVLKIYLPMVYSSMIKISIQRKSENYQKNREANKGKSNANNEIKTTAIMKYEICNLL